MHIEPGFIAPAKILVANGAAVAVLGYYARDLVKTPWDVAKTALAAVFFSVFMESFHLPVGPSELHFVGASASHRCRGGDSRPSDRIAV
jgi:ABC-type Co2+ transport system permease subunit